MKIFFLNLFFYIFSNIHIKINCQNQNDSNNRKFIDITIIDEIKNSIKISSKSHYSKLLNETDSSYLAYYYSKKSNNSIVGAVHLQMIDRKLDYISKILFIDCEEVEEVEFPACTINKNSQGDFFPRIRVLIPNRVKFDEKKQIIPHTEIGFNKEYVSDKTLYEFITENIISFSVRLNKENFKFFEKKNFFNKIILFTEKDSTPLIYRGLSNYFYDRIIFAEIGKNETELVSKFNIIKFPTILILENSFFSQEDYVTHKYEGMMFISDLKNFIEKFALKEKHYMVRLRDLQAKKEKFLFLNKFDYDQFFDENKNEKKMVYFHEDDHDYNDDYSIPEALKELADLSSGYFKFASFNCRKVRKICQKNFLLDKLPSLVFFNEQNEDYFQMMKKSFVLPLTKKDLHQSINLKYGNKFEKLSDTTINEFKKMVMKTKSNKQYMLMYFFSDKKDLGLQALRFVSHIPQIEKKIAIYAIENPNEDLKSYLKITGMPHLILILHEVQDKSSIKKIPFSSFRSDDRKFSYIDIKIFLENNIGLFEKEPSKLLINKDYEYLIRKVSDTKSFKEAWSELEFRKYCLHNHRGNCLIYLLNGEFDHELNSPNLKFKKQIHLMNEVIQAEDYKSFSQFYFVNATCHDELAKSFKVGKKNLPTLIYYNSQYHLFNKMQTKLEKENIYEFLDKMLSSKLPGEKIEPNKIKFEFKNCKKIQKISENIDFDKLDRIKMGLEDEDVTEELNLPDDEEDKGKKDEI